MALLDSVCDLHREKGDKSQTFGEIRVREK